MEGILSGARVEEAAAGSEREDVGRRRAVALDPGGLRGFPGRMRRGGRTVIAADGGGVTAGDFPER